MTIPSESDDPVQRLEEEIDAHKADLEKRLGSLRADEAAEMARASSTCVYLAAHIVGCQYATIHYPAQKTIPTFTFFKPCIRMPPKEQPDLDCLDCPLHNLRMWGAENQASHAKRHPNHGVIFPIVSEELADAIVALQGQHGATELRRPVHEVHALQEYITNREAELPQLKAREEERRQTGGL